MSKSNFFLVLLFSITFTGCSTIMNNLPWVYTIDIQQGNIINQEMIDQLRPKMTKRQILYIMGSSMLVDVFHPKRWDYLYSEQLSGEERKQKRLSLFFNDNDVLIGIQGDFKPSSEPVARKSDISTVDVPPRELEKTLWEKITGMFSDDTPTLPTHKTENVKPVAIQSPANEKSSKTITEAIANETSQTKENSEQSLEQVTNAKETIITTSENKTPEITNNQSKNKVISITPLKEEKQQTIENLYD